MLDLIKQAAKEINASGNPVEIFEAVVISPPPNLTIKLKGNDSLVIPKELIVVAELLTKHRREVRLVGPQVGESMSAEGLGPHTHDIFSLDITGTLEFLNELAAGEQVMVIRFSGGQKYWICDRIVQY